MKNFSKNNIKCPLCPNMSKDEFTVKLIKLSYCKLNNILYFALISKFLTYMKGLQRFSIIAWVVEQELIKENSDKKEASFMPSNPWLIKRKLRWFWSKGRISEKTRKFKIFKVVNFKNRHLRPVKIYCREKTQLVHKLFFLLSLLSY